MQEMLTTIAFALSLLFFGCLESANALPFAPPSTSFEKKVAYSYGCVIDMGSKGSRVSVFMWPSDSATPYADVEYAGDKSPWYYKITPGVATFESNPAGAGPYMKPLLDYAFGNLQTLTDVSKVPMFVKGTDNLRQLGPASDEILTSIYKYVSQNYEFLIQPHFVSLLPGILEGGFLWVSVNTLQNRFATQKESDCVGILDMGSGSTQMVFITEKGTFIPNDYYYRFVYEEKVYTPYSHSYTGFGYIASLYAVNASVLNTTTATVVNNPCFLQGFATTMTQGDQRITVLGSGDWDACVELNFNHLDKTKYCNFPNCSFDGAFQPMLRGDFLAVSNYYDITHDLGLKEKSTVQEVINAAQAFCALDWHDAQAQYPDVDPDYLETYCFGATYISTLLHQGYGFSLDSTIDFAKDYNGTPISWAMGEMIYELQLGW